MTGIVSHSDGTTYARCDISGLYKRNDDGSWTQMMDFLKPSEKNLMGVAGVAIAPQDSNIVYAAAGQFSVDSNTSEPMNGEVFKTTNGGKTWKKAGLSKPFGSLESGRVNGEPIAVSPYDINVVYVLTKGDGLWKTEDGATTWQKVEGFAPQSAVTTGFVEFSNASENTIYVNVNGEGVYRSDDKGISWTITASSPTNLKRVAQQNDGTLLCSADDGIYRYKNNAWSCVYNRGTGSGIGGIDIDPFNNKHIIAITTVGKDGSTGIGNNHILESYNGGDSFTDRYDDHNNAEHNNFVNSSIYENQFTSASSIVFDGKRKGVVYISEWFGIFETGNITSKPITIYRSSKGIENTLSYAIKAIPGKYSVMAAFADVGAMGWINTDSMATQMKDATADIQDATEFDYCVNMPEFVARVGAYHKDSTGNKNAGFAVSTNGGSTWTTKTLPESWSEGLGDKIHIGPHVAVSSGVNANGYPTILMTGNDGIYYSEDAGDTWNKSNGVSYSAHGLWVYCTPIASDKIDGNTFYVCQNKNLYVSRDGGKTFTVYNNKVPDSKKHVQIIASPSDAGTIVLTTGNGVYISGDYGKNFTQTGNFVTPSKAAFGVGQTNPVLYVFDTSDDNTGLYMSPNMGEDWVKVKIQNNNFCGITDMDADKATEGIVYISTSNRGVFRLELK